jgi:hypothetical protein
MVARMQRCGLGDIARTKQLHVNAEDHKKSYIKVLKKVIGYREMIYLRMASVIGNVIPKMHPLPGWETNLAAAL